MKILAVLFVLNVAIVWSFDPHIIIRPIDDYSKNIEFSGNIYKEIAKDNYGNFVVCPISLELILSLLYDGARGLTADEISYSVHLPYGRRFVNPLIESVLSELNNQPDVVTVNVANKVYVTNDIKLSKDFKNMALDVFKSDIENIDFRTPDVTIHKINKWVSDQTHNYIKDLLTESDVDSDTKSILVNTLFFKATWVKRFAKGDIKKSNFYINERETVPVDMLDTIEDIKYHENDYLRAKFIELPYNGHSLSMVIVLPESKYGLSHLEDNIHQVVDTQLSDMHSVHVNIPKFKIESTIRLIPILETLGITKLFTPNADLSGIAGKNSGLYVDNVIQKSIIGLNENGTLAASSTAAINEGKSLPEREFIANHPFIYYIKSTVGVLFIGRYAGHE
ncbi:hypothetical protein RN001_010729 [Aquatica leii]|uniref:Serpin domain-containing protein n=1 Tax=Aquatica leii TaxID=1421715 RepID=A0AAN7QHP9_9COLE|nr:hypothetical protein RN001_010729 [Aquatica leii]